jgi:ABC-type Mn2+/Zn2+ transport system permease subunit
MMVDGLVFSLLTGLAVGFSAGYLGSLMVLEKMALVGDALSHVALPGLALGILFSFNPFLGAFAFLFVSAVVIWHIQRITKLSFETIVGAVFTLALAIGILLIRDLDALEAALFGDITTVGLLDTALAAIISIIAISLTKVIYNRIVLTMISEELAISKGVNVARTNLLYLLLVSMVVAIGIKITGTLLVGFLVVVPAASAKNLSSNLLRYSVLSSIFGAISSSLGVLLSGYLSYLTPPPPPGPLVVLSGVLIFLAAVMAKWASKFKR